MTASSISIVLATHNGAAFLGEQLESLLSQSLPPLEIVVGDDASTDDTLAILNSFASRSKVPIRVHRNLPGLGFRENFLDCCSHAKGEWIAFCDQDDVWHPQKLATCAQHFGREGVVMVTHAAHLIDAQGKTIGRFRQGIDSDATKPPLAYDPWSTFWGFSLVFKRRLLDLCSSDGRFVDYIAPRHKIAHDRWVCFLAQCVGNTVELAQPLAGYRQHGANAFGAGDKRARNIRKETVERHRHYVAATERMLDIVESMPAWAEHEFPAFDRARAYAFFSAALAQLKARSAVYEKSRGGGVVQAARNFIDGSYADVRSGRMRWRSLWRDVIYCASPGKR
ncbi:glycosyltransferase [Variovorax dokdonensis]|uniref:Glycosyltransferase n=1 Tax=Variovorax dokdonensis TaxID=344883 RepID=A0ABT7N4Z3_9BURK|nr:glycosyltransferase [Variovorax dokdonensis]MDM0043014.1 glycosyltransferase [Variovorax dokdonensis]